MASRTHLAVAAIDFGTSFSSWAFSLRYDYERDPLNVTTKNWNSGDNISMKTPTAVLINPDGKTFEAFGYDAENKYIDLAEEEEHHNYYYFRRFKMMLYKQKTISRDMTLDAENGKPLPAILVFQLALQYLKDDLLSEYSSKIKGGLSVTDIHWCLTVPAIWNETAKFFMREAAIKAGINSFDLTIVLEPEAASVFCKYLPVEKSYGGSLASLKPGSTYILIDSGGGTTDICCHEQLEDANMKEIYRASGAAVGGTDVDNAFVCFLIKLFGREVWDEFARENEGDVLSLFRSFEVKKRDIQQTGVNQVTLPLPAELVNILSSKTKQDVNDAVSKAGFKDEIKVMKGNKIKINGNCLRKETCDDMLKRFQDVLSNVCNAEKLKEIKTVLLVGGFSESPVIRDAVEKAFPDKHVITIVDASLAVVKGAVIYGHDNSIMHSRIARYTYGRSNGTNFDSQLHDKNMITLYKGIERVVLFESIVKAGQELPSGRMVSGMDFIPLLEDQSNMTIEIYAVNDDTDLPVYCKDPRCTFLGKIIIPITTTTVQLDHRMFTMKFKFGGTEISAVCTEEITGITTEASIDFLG